MLDEERDFPIYDTNSYPCLIHSYLIHSYLFSLTSYPSIHSQKKIPKVSAHYFWNLYNVKLRRNRYFTAIFLTVLPWRTM